MSDERQEMFDYIHRTFEGIKIKGSKVTFKGTSIGSKLYPLNNVRNAVCFNVYNTHPVDEGDKIREVFDKVDFELGRCYTNTTNLYNECIRSGIENVDIYVGWVHTCSDRIVHHCWLVYDGNKILDGSSQISDFMAMVKISEERLSLEEARKALAEAYFEGKKLKNSENCCCGRTLPNWLYVGCKCGPNEGLEIYRKLMKDFPRHPSYKNNNADGSSKTQRMILDRLGK